MPVIILLFILKLIIMPSNYRAYQSSLETEDGKRLWYPMLVKNGGPIVLSQLAAKIAEKSSLTIGDVYNVVSGLISEMNDKLINGNSVRLDGLGSFTLVARAGGQGVETPEEVNAGQIKSVSVRFTPTAKRTATRGTSYALLEGLEFQRWSGDPYNPQYKLSGAKKPEGGGGNTGGGDGIYIDPNA
jgi:predicted histone-like DNA-binding protein